MRIEHTHGLSGHSDADVALHALTDAILGAAAAGDIGDHFPPSDPQWRGASSDRFLAHSVALAREAGYGVGHVDVTIVCEAPRIGPHKAAMRARDQERTDTLRMTLSSLRAAEKDLQRPLKEDEELQVLQRERKQRTEAAEGSAM